MRIVVHLTPEATDVVRAPRTRGAERDVLAWLETPLTPVHSGTSDSTLAAFFEIEVNDPADATRLLERLRADPAVDGAYVKPDDELPM
jgi:hypothetical protein